MMFEDGTAIPFEGTGSDNPMAFRYYDAGREVAGKTMRDHLRFSVAYWHTFGGRGGDPFGDGTQRFGWDEIPDPVDRAYVRLEQAFKFVCTLGAPYYTFHDVDLVDEGDSIRESERRLKLAVQRAGELQKATGIKLLWGTANLFSHPRYMNGAMTNPDFAVVAHAGAQVKRALEATVALGGENFVFWGGREGYQSLLNTDMKREREHMARFLHAAVAYGDEIGFQGTMLIEPKPMEPMKHQYDFDAATVIGFLREFGLADRFKLNIEANHATLAQHSFPHELRVAADAGMLGSIDANRGDAQNGWDTDQFPCDPLELTQALLVVLESGGLGSGGLNFDAKVRRNSCDPIDRLYGHIGAMDVFARALIAADKLRNDPHFRELRDDRYRSFTDGNGAAFARGDMGLTNLARLAIETGEPRPRSGRQELLENIVNRCLD